MPIVSKVEIEKRRAAALARVAPVPPVMDSPGRSAVVEPAPTAAPALPAAQPEISSGTAARPRERGHATRGESGKWQPTGDYPVGFGRPPEATRFRKGGKPGPGRPKGAVSHDTLLKRELEQKQLVRLNGHERNVPIRELIAKTTVRAAVDGKDRDARRYVLAQSERLYPAPDDQGATASSLAELSASDALSIEEFKDDLRRELRAEIEAEFAARMSGDAA